MKSKWYQWHHWFGLPLAIFLCFVLATGTLAVLSNEIDWLANTAIRSQSTTSPQQIAWSNIYQQALAHKAKDEQLLSISAPVHSGFAAQVTVKNGQGQRHYLYFNPVTGQYQGQGSFFNVKTVLRRLHRHLMMPATAGITIVTLTSFLLLGSLISGLVLHKNWLSALFRVPRTANARVFWGDLHRLAGLWSSWLILILVITGFWYLAERWGLDAEYPQDAKIVVNEPIVNESIEPDKSGDTKQANSLLSPQVFAGIIKQARVHRPELEIEHIRLNLDSKKPLLIEGQAGHTLVRARANNIAFDPSSGEKLSSRYADELSFHIRVSEAADPLHFGTWGGYPSKFLYFIFGLVLTSLSISGTYIFALRQRKIARTEPKVTRERWLLAWQHMGWLKWLASALVLSALVLTPIVIISS